MPRKGENIYLRKDGRWEGRYRKGQVDGKTRFGYVFGHSYREAKEKLLAARISWQAHCREEARKEATFGAVSAMWLSEAGRFLKESTVAKYQEYLDYYILPELGAMPAGAISDEDAASFIRRLGKSGGKKQRGLAAPTLSQILRILKAIRTYAVRIGVAVNFSLERLVVKCRRKSLRVLTEEEWTRLRAYLESAPTPCHAGILIAMLTGIRIGELCAVRWDDISLTERQLRIHQTLQRIRDKSGEAKTRIIITPPKSDSGNRIIPLPEELCAYLAPLYRERASLLTGEAGKFVEPRTMQRWFKTVLERCGIEPATFHTLRHTFATRCVEAGFDPKCLSVILGHADVSVTFNRYVHPTMETKRRNMEKFMDFTAQAI